MKLKSQDFAIFTSGSIAKTTMHLSIIMIAFLGLISNSIAQNTAHSNWDILNKSTKRAIWMWKPNTTNQWDGVTGYKQLVDNHKKSQDNLIDFCRNKSINTIYVFVGSWEWDQATFNTGKLYNEAGYASLIQKANAAGIRVWALFYLYDDPNNLTGYAAATTKIIDALGGFNQRHPYAGFDGIQADNEPSKTSTYTDMIDFCKLAQAKTNTWKTTLKNAGATPFIFSSVLKPAWVLTNYTYNKVTKEMFKFIVDAIDHVALMDYYDTQTKLKEIAIPVLSYSASLNPIKPVAIGIETGAFAVSNTINTYDDEIKAETNATRFNKIEADLDAVEGVFKTYKSFERFAIHDLPQYYAHWFGKEQGDWLDLNSTWSTPPYVDLKKDASQFANWPNTLPTNVAPVITSTPSATIATNTLYTYTITATDGNNDALTFSAKTIPAWLSFNPNTKVLTGIPGIKNLNNQTVILSVSDGKVVTEQAFTIFVNSAPTFAYAPILTATQGLLYNYIAKASDLNADQLTYTTPVLPTWLSFNASTQTLTGRPTLANIGNHHVTIRVTDGKVSMNQVFIINVVSISKTSNYILNEGAENLGTWDLWASKITNSCARTGNNGIQLTVNDAGAQQTVYNLKPMTRYAFNAYINSGGSNVSLGTKSFGGPVAETICNSTTFTKFTKIFITGDTNTSAIVYLYRNGNTTTVCADDFEVLEAPIPLAVETHESDNTLKIYPNPASNQITIDFNLSNSTLCDITILNSQGQKVATLVNNQPLRAGFYHESFDLQAYAEGIYFVKCTTNQLSNTKKIIVIH